MRSSKKDVLLRGLAAIAVAASLLVGCNDSSPTEPKVVAAPTPAPPVASIWNNTAQVIARTTGPGNCLGGSGGGTVEQAFRRSSNSGGPATPSCSSLLISSSRRTQAR